MWDKLLYQTDYGVIITTKLIHRPRQRTGFGVDFDGNFYETWSEELASPIVIRQRSDIPIKTLRIKIWYRKLRSLICH